LLKALNKRGERRRRSNPKETDAWCLGMLLRLCPGNKNTEGGQDANEHDEAVCR